MTVSAPVRPAMGGGVAARQEEQAGQVEVLVCGIPEHGDDGAPLAAAARLVAILPDDVRLRAVGQLKVDDLLSVPKDAGVVIVDDATGIDPGWIVRVPLHGLIGRERGLRPRSSHALVIPEVIGLAEMIRGRPLRGFVVAIGGVEFGIGDAFSWPVSAALGTFSEAILAAIDRVRADLVGEPALG